ncbi:hypothetical protein [Citrobacter koseri]|uniref:hypothetical protein n=1 Tax=Citrobacter koseri TaxID=545 RepID=UPI0023AEE814|nr:hypothetical protein [Citrobacter koseri]
MLYINPEFFLSGRTYNIRALQVPTAALREKMPEIIWEVSTERADFIGCLPLRYSGLSLRRRLIRLMLTLQKYGEASGGPESRGRGAFSPAEDYARSVIELRSIMAGVQQDMAQLRKEVRRKTDDFLWRFAAGTKA